MARVGHVIDGQDAEIVRYLERFGEVSAVPSRASDDTPVAATSWHVLGTRPAPALTGDEPQGSDQDLYRRFALKWGP